jgi:hypothetical protein
MSRDTRRGEIFRDDPDRKSFLAGVPPLGIRSRTFESTPRLSILGAKNDVKDDFTQRLGHTAVMKRNGAGSEARFQRWRFLGGMIPGARPQA